MSRRIATLLVDVAIGLAAGLVATRTYGLAQEALYRSTPRHIRRQEERVRPAPSSQVAAEKTAASLGYCLDERRRDLAGTCGSLRSRDGLGAGLRPLAAPWQDAAPRGRRPHGSVPVAHCGRGLVARSRLQRAEPRLPDPDPCPRCSDHLVYGAAVAATAEALYRLTNSGPDPGKPLSL